MKIEIKLKGALGENWSDWFGNLSIYQEGEVTLLIGFAADESEFHGILNQIRDLNLKLISAHIIE